VEPAVAPAQPGRIALAEMARAIETLAAEQREALLLVVLEGMSYAEAATILEIPMGTLMSRLGRARAALRLATGAGDEPRLRTVK
jgi:RNA polymerase sigma-70 factor (ECF subfamily)